MVARIELSGPGVERLRGNATAADRLVERARARASRRKHAGSHPAFDATLLGATMNGSTLVARFRVRDIAVRYPGVTVVDRFVRLDGDAIETAHRVATDELVVHGPPGTTAAVIPPGGTVDSGAVVLSEPVATDAYVAFVPRPGTLTWPLGRLAVAVTVLRWAAAPAALAALPTALVGLLAVGLVRGYDRGGGSGDADTSGADGEIPPSALFPMILSVAVLAVTAIGTLADSGATAVVPGIGGPISSLVALAVVAAVVVAGSVVARRLRVAGDRDPDRDERAPLPTAIAGAVDGSLVDLSRWRRPVGLGVATVGFAWVVVAATPATGSATTVATVAMLVPAVGFPALGYRTVRPGGARSVAAVLVAAGPVLAFALVVEEGTDLAGATAMALFAWAIATVVVGTVLFYVTRWVARRD